MRHLTACFKRLLLLLSVISLITFPAYAQSAVESILSSDADYVILATITGAEDSTFILSKEYVINGKDDNLPDSITVDKFRYSYCIEHADKYNNPQMGDNIIITLNESNGGYTVGQGIFKTDTVSYRTLKVLVPLEMKDQDCMPELLALAYFIRTDGVNTDFIYENDRVYVQGEGKRFLLNELGADYITFIDNTGVNNSHDIITDVPVKVFPLKGELWITAILFLSSGLLLGALVLIIFNLRIHKKGV